jgi:hypothetical protein
MLAYVKGRQFLVERKEKAHINSGEGVQVMELSLRVTRDELRPDADPAST